MPLAPQPSPEEDALVWIQPNGSKQWYIQYRPGMQLGNRGLELLLEVVSGGPGPVVEYLAPMDKGGYDATLQARGLLFYVRIDHREDVSRPSISFYLSVICTDLTCSSILRRSTKSNAVSMRQAEYGYQIYG